MIRLATKKDVQDLLKIYAFYIDTPITFEYTLPTEQEFAQRMTNIQRVYPYLVYEENGKVLGYTYAYRQMEREAYQWNAELSIYLNPSVTSRGIGKRFYGRLEQILKLQGIKTLYGGVTIPNIRSARLHVSTGFHRLGVYRRTGYKCGKWHDVEWFEKQILPYNDAPQPIRSIRDIPQENLKEILQG